MGAFVLLSIGGATAQSGCTQPISSDGDYSGSWTSGCLSENTPTGPTSPPSGTRYARFYTFTLSEDADIAIDLTSTTDPYLYLMQGTGTNGNVLYENDDVVSGNTNSRISENLSAGDYTIEATTYDLETTGDFTLTIQGLPDALTPTVTPTLAPGDTANRYTYSNFHSVAHANTAVNARRCAEPPDRARNRCSHAARASLNAG